jgi:hypothetical protein
VKFTDYTITPSPPGTTAAGYAEIITGLYPIIVNNKQPSTKRTDPTYNQSFANLMNRNDGIVAWGLIGPPKSDGLIVVAGSDVGGNDTKIAKSFESIGVVSSVVQPRR